MNYLDELKQFNLTEGKYVIFGSGPLAIRGLWENHDIDILVTEDLRINKNHTFVKLKYLLLCKKLMDGEKHKRDIGLIEDFLAKNG